MGVDNTVFIFYKKLLKRILEEFLLTISIYYLYFPSLFRRNAGTS